MLAKLLQRFEGHIGIDRLGAISGQDAEMMHFARLAGLHNQPSLHAQALADQVVMHRGRGERGRNGNAIRRHRTIRKDENILVGQHHVGRVHADSLQRAGKPSRAFRGGPCAIDGRGAKRAVDQFLDGTDFFHIGVGQDRLQNLEALMRARLMTEQIGPRPDHRHQRHHQFFANRIDRWIGDLCEILLEVVVKQLGLLRQNG